LYCTRIELGIVKLHLPSLIKEYDDADDDDNDDDAVDDDDI